MPEFVDSLQALCARLSPFLNTLDNAGPHAETLAEFPKVQKLFAEDVQRFQASIDQAAMQREKAAATSAALDKLSVPVLQLAPKGQVREIPV